MGKYIYFCEENRDTNVIIVNRSVTVSLSLSNYVIVSFSNFKYGVILILVNLCFFIMSATLGYLYRHIKHNEKMCVQFLQDRELLPSLNENNNRCT